MSDFICNFIKLLSLWLTPDFPRAGVSISPNSFKLKSLYFNLNMAISLKFSGSLSKPKFSFMYVMFLTCLIQASTVFCKFAVSQFTILLTLFRTSLSILTFSSSKRAAWAPIMFKKSTILSPSFKYTT